MHDGDLRQADQPQRRPARRDRTGGADGNQRLTTLAGGVLLVLLAVEGVTILSVRQLFVVHAFVGMLLLGPLAVKLASTLYRFARYYTGSPAYRRKGAPQPLLRAIGPVVIAATVAVFGTGVLLLFTRPGRGEWLIQAHKAAFVVWVVVTGVHVLAHVLRIPAAVAAEWRPRRQRARRALASRFGRPAAVVAGAGPRTWLLVTAVAAGVALGVATGHLAHTWSDWLAHIPDG